MLVVRPLNLVNSVWQRQDLAYSAQARLGGALSPRMCGVEKAKACEKLCGEVAVATEGLCHC